MRKPESVTISAVIPVAELRRLLDRLSEGERYVLGPASQDSRDWLVRWGGGETTRVEVAPATLDALQQDPRRQRSDR